MITKSLYINNCSLEIKSTNDFAKKFDYGDRHISDPPLDFSQLNNLIVEHHLKGSVEVLSNEQLEFFGGVQ